jgi:lactate dehydrogenase-like 2-hydroxyacid dehydrogenase
VIYASSGRKDDQEQIDEGFSKRFGVDVRWVEKDQLAEESDLVVVLCNLNDNTKGLVGKEFLGRMKPTSILVNAARVSLMYVLLSRPTDLDDTPTTDCRGRSWIPTP